MLYYNKVKPYFRNKSIAPLLNDHMVRVAGTLPLFYSLYYYLPNLVNQDYRFSSSFIYFRRS